MKLCRHELTDEEQSLIDRHLSFYLSLANGDHEPTSEAQRHFVQVTQGLVKACTPHEFAYMKWKQNQALLDKLAREELSRRNGIPMREEGFPDESFFSREDLKKLVNRGYPG